MTNPYYKPQPGDMPKRSAKFEADLVDVVQWARRQMTSSGGRPGSARGANGVIDVRNDSGSNVAQYGILGINDVVFTPTNALSTFQTSPIYSGVTPTVADHDGDFCVVLDPIASGSIGKARIDGIVAAKIQVTAGLEWYDHADVTHNDATKLTLLPSGAAQVLWKEEGTGTKWALIRLGNPHGNVTLQMKLDATLTAQSSAAASIWDGDPLVDTTNNCTLYAGEANGSLMSSGSSFASGKYVWGTWFPRSRKWLLSNAGC
jgi:hypothetical protein